MVVWNDGPDGGVEAGLASWRSQAQTDKFKPTVRQNIVWK